MKNKNTSSRIVIAKILKYAVPYRFYFILSIVMSLLSVAAGLIAPYLIGNAIDLMKIPNNIDFEKVIKIAIILVALYTLSAIFSWLSTTLATILTQKSVRAMRLDFIKKLHSLPLSYIDSRSIGDLISRIINDLETVSQGLLQGFLQLFSGVATIIFTIIMMFYLNAYIGLAIVIITPVSIFISYFIAKRGHRLFSKQQEELGKLNGISEELISNMKTVKAYNYEETAIKRFEKINDSFKYAYRDAHFNSALINPTTRIINSIVYIIAGVMGIRLGVSIGNIGAFLMYANQFSKPFNEVSAVVAELQSAISAAERVFTVLEEQNKEDDNENAKSLYKPNGEITFENVDFSYDKSKELIKNFNLSVNKGERIAIVGPTGAGKTTLVNLLMRFYELDKGAIYLDGTDITEIKRKDLRSNFGMVLQNTWLYSATIRDNIAYGNENATDKEIQEVAEKCHCHEFIIAREKGYATEVSDSGSNMSSGQRQLICIARVMLTKPAMLILDEATSNIDTRTEGYIQSAFNELMKDRTSFVIAHRLSTIKNSDKILVLNEGNIIEIGTHNELIEKQGFYYDLYNSQFTES